jgi:shikimate kinase
VQRVILIVGPSGVGKSLVCNALKSEFDECLFFHLDGLAAKWAYRMNWIAKESVGALRELIKDDELFLGVGLQAIGFAVCCNRNMSLAIDVGAGFQCARSAQQMHKLFPVICLNGSPESVFERIRKSGRPGSDVRRFDEYQRTEFNSERKKVYASANVTIDTTCMTSDEVILKTRDALLSLLVD